LAGFSSARVTGVVIRVGLTATVDLSLKPGPLQTEVTVTADAVQLELQSPAVGNVVTGRQMIELPLVGRNPYSLVTLAPGVVDRGNTGTGPLINGARSNSTSVMLDGAEQRNSTTNDLNYSPPLESVQEFRVVTNGLSAEFGRTGGGVITAATRSGTNAFHGSVYGYLRSDRFNANSWTNNRNNVARGKEDIKQYGFTLGGPVRKNRTFFFVNVERSKSLTPDNLIRTVPTLLQRVCEKSPAHYDLRPVDNAAESCRRLRSESVSGKRDPRRSNRPDREGDPGILSAADQRQCLTELRPRANAHEHGSADGDSDGSQYRRSPALWLVPAEQRRG